MDGTLSGRDMRKIVEGAKACRWGGGMGGTLWEVVISGRWYLRIVDICDFFDGGVMRRRGGGRIRNGRIW